MQNKLNKSNGSFFQVKDWNGQWSGNMCATSSAWPHQVMKFSAVHQKSNELKKKQRHTANVFKSESDKSGHGKLSQVKVNSDDLIESEFAAVRAVNASIKILLIFFLFSAKKMRVFDCRAELRLNLKWTLFRYKIPKFQPKVCLCGACAVYIWK